MVRMSPMTSLKIATYNIHKGFSQFNQRLVIHELRERLRELDADIVFLQEVQGEHLQHPQRHTDYPSVPQHEFLADEFWAHHAYGMNAVYENGHHGNAILVVFPSCRVRTRMFPRTVTRAGVCCTARSILAGHMCTACVHTSACSPKGDAIRQKH